jgi:molybdopterin-guanine dinucleotide biosynthesis protein A
MKAAILAGGHGTRIGEEKAVRPISAYRHDMGQRRSAVEMWADELGWTRESARHGQWRPGP